MDKVDAEFYEQMKFAKKQKDKEVKDFNLKKDKEIFKKNIITKLRTTLIGSISIFEEFFGRIWGFKLNKNKEDLSQNEKLWAAVWQKCRNEILNNGNNQLRNAECEIENYDIISKKVFVKYKVKEKKEN